MSDATATAPDEAEFRARCRAFLEEHAVGINLGGDADSGGSKRLEAGRLFRTRWPMQASPV